MYFISMYYKRYELQWRMNLFFSSSIMAGAVSGVSTVHTVHTYILSFLAEHNRLS